MEVALYILGFVVAAIGLARIANTIILIFVSAMLDSYLEVRGKWRELRATRR